MLEELAFTLPDLRRAYAQGLQPTALIAEVFRRIAHARDPGIFIHVIDRDTLLAQAEALGRFDPDLPFWGIPFAVKDNIDVADCPTTVACPAFAYAADRDAFVVARLRAAGALPIGKTNLDQFATGLVGVRTPWPAPRNAHDPDIVPGGSSSGSAVAVARGIVSFSLGTDTAGSGRVPAALNNIVGLKPTPGALSTTGVVPACRTLDAVSIFALTVADAHEIFHEVCAYDADDPYAKPVRAAAISSPPPQLRIGIPSRNSIRFFGDDQQQDAFDAACDRLRAIATVTEIDFTPFYAVATLLYEGAWVAERDCVIGPLLDTNPEAVLPVIRRIVGRAKDLSATDAFRDFYRLADLRRQLQQVLEPLDMICVPSIPNFPTVAELQADPIGPNSRLGTYTNFANLLGLCALAVPAPARADGRPGGVTLLAQEGHDALLAGLGTIIERWGSRSLGATGWAIPDAAPRPVTASTTEVEIAVCGAHMSGLPLNGELTRRGGRFLRQGPTMPEYNLYSLPGGPPRRPGMVRCSEGGTSIQVEVWALPATQLGSFIAGIPAPLCIGTIRMADGTTPKGFLCETAATSGEAINVSAFGDWRLVLAEATP
ncbi:allophanate hydrolase [Paracoccus aestuariivivens]|uniref:Allophanate hydrolase n=2 Tax=Paracoccus aestuariivivens TaxID=1820333 RepID=A0A6L6JCL4_9RHOB|nr:allophanate hydrolase [Paracoccus aestuariivivens]